MADRPLPAYEGDAPYIFVCYGHADADIVHPEIRWLQDQGFNVWWDEGIDPGTVWREGLAKAIKDSSLFLFFVTPNSVASAHCLRELNFSQEEQKPFLAVHLRATQLPDALRLSISDRQAILVHELPRDEFENKLRRTVASFIPIGSQASPQQGESRAPPSTRRRSVLVYALTAVSILVVGALFLTWPRTPTPQDTRTADEAAAQTAAPKSIAVLAFENMSDDPQMAYLGDGIAEELMNALYHVGLRVASRTDAFSFKGARTRTRDIGRELGVELVLEGSVRRSGDKLRITAQLIDVADGFHLWSDVYERPVGDLFDVQDTIVREVSGELLGALGVATSTVDLAGTRNVRAYDKFMLGRYEQRVDTPEAIDRAIGQFEEAIRLDSDFHRAMASLARAHSRRAIFTGERAEAQTKISEIQREFEQRAATWRRDPEWWASLLEISIVTWDPDGIEQALAAGIRAKRSDPAVQNPVTIDPYAVYARLLGQSRLHAGAIKYAEVSGDGCAVVAQAQYALGERELAIELMGRVQCIPSVVPFLLGRMLASEGRIDEAREILNDPRLTSPYRDYLGWEIAFNAGDLEVARAILEALEAADVSPTYLGVYRLQMGDVARGFRHLEHAVDQRDEILLYLGNALDVYVPDDVLNDPRYLKILEATGFTAEWARELCQRAAALTPVTGIDMSCLANL